MGSHKEQLMSVELFCSCSQHFTRMQAGEAFPVFKLSQNLSAKIGCKHTGATKKTEKLEEFQKSIWFAPSIGLAKSTGGTFIFLEFPEYDSGTRITPEMVVYRCALCGKSKIVVHEPKIPSRGFILASF